MTIDTEYGAGGDQSVYYNHLFGGDGADRVTFAVRGDGYANNNYLYGGSGDDVVVLSDSADGYVRGNRLRGGEGDDVLIIDASNAASEYNYIYGEAGNDTANTGHGTDYVYLGTGLDTMVHEQGDGIDYLYDFTAGSGDVLDLRGHGLAGVTVTQSGNYAFVDIGGGDGIYVANTTATALSIGSDILI